MSSLFRTAVWLEGASTDGYGLRPIPHVLDTQISSLLDQWHGLPQEERMAESSTISDSQRVTLLAYSETMASKAVRDKSRTDIYFGLLALGIDGWRVDWRDNTMALSLHYHSTVLIGVDPPALFTEVATSMAPNVKKAFELFLKRKAEDRSIDAMGFCESEDKGGFRYKRTW